MCLKLQKLKEDHVRRGHYYLEYLKFAREPTCKSCEKERWTAGVPSNWFPVPDLSDTAALPRGYIPSNVSRLSDEIESTTSKCASQEVSRFWYVNLFQRQRNAGGVREVDG